MKQLRYGDPLGGRTRLGEPMAFLREAATAGPGPCIEWPYARDAGGYGRVTWKGKRKTAHAVALVLSGRPRPSPAHMALHAPEVCHNRACVRGAHLRWGTHQENHYDRTIDATDHRGERNPRARLSIDDVREIRRSSQGTAELAHRYGVTDASIRNVLLRKTWADVD